jgi:cytosine/adenosine deaminase-related metal-dependent hydrolase
MSPKPLQDAARRRSSDAIARGRAAIAELGRRGEQVTFQAVARQAGVSRQWLYTHPELRAEIERARATRRVPTAPGVPAAERSSEASLRQRVESLLAENRRLRAENAELREELELAYGHQREARLAGQSPDHAG